MRKIPEDFLLGGELQLIKLKELQILMAREELLGILI